MTSTGLSSTAMAARAGAGSEAADHVAASPERLRDDLVNQAALGAPDIAELVRLYYRHVAPDEIIDNDPHDLVDAVRANLRLASDRVVGRPVVRFVSPTPAHDGWTCPTTVVQVVTDDMPYLVDSLVAALTRADVAVASVVHPIVVVRRDIAGRLLEVLPSADPVAPPADGLVESWMTITIDAVTETKARELTDSLVRVLHDVREAVEDTAKMVGMARSLALESRSVPPSVPAVEAEDTARLLTWLADGHFTFLGYRRYDVIEGSADGQVLRASLASGLGVLRDDRYATQDLAIADTGMAPPPPTPLVLTEASTPPTVHRYAYPYCVGVRVFDERGQIRGEHRFLGVLTSAARHEDVLDIPVIERRVREAIHRAGFPLESYSGQRMLDVIQDYPRPELFSTDVQSLYETATGVLALPGRRRLRSFLRRDPYRRFFSCLVYLPRDHYTTATRLAMGDVLIRETRGRGLEYSTRVGETDLARVHFIVHTDPAVDVDVDPGVLQRQLADAARGWDDRMVEVVVDRRRAQGDGGHPISVESATEQGQRFAAAFSESYKQDFSADEGFADLMRLRALGRTEATGDLDVVLYTPDGAEPGERRFKLYLVGERVTLSQVLPVLARMDVEVVDERPYRVLRQDGSPSWIFDFGIRVDPAVLNRISPADLPAAHVRFQEAFAAAWRGDIEVDGFNALVLRAGLDWRQAAVLRAYAKYLRQAGTPYSQDYIEDAVLADTEVAAALVELFEVRFDLTLESADRLARAEDLTTRISRMIDQVTSLDADRILRSLLALILATLRTNYGVRDECGRPRTCLAVKFDPHQIPGLPEPRPRFEIFVYSPRVEGVHLRFGPVARGGLRWSDRREDFRTEILGLAKAQAVKNAVIVPVGAKGGFVVKRPPASTGDPARDREATLAEGIACYQTFVSSLLELTDNLVDGAVVPAHQVVRYDGDDTYLVVAADKGTATFSDIANEVAAGDGFWLGDAFASGGSSGYDHKRMGITARGAWESVQRHFRELGVDTRTEDFTVVGIGDMSGDVFGNGMLLSQHIRLVAAFDHRHIFLDPDPDAARSYAERRRLFDLPRSSWADYDPTLISEGGGVWPRSAKSVPVHPRARAMLGLDPDVTALSTPELVKAILLAPVDLLWNGGIGTYVKASTETHAEVGDKANDAVRVNGAALRVKVVGEGGNLGLTQRGRIEFARAGGKVNTDALDNSAGVDCSDHEVNIKILVDRLVRDGRLTRRQRDALLADMTDEVAELVLADNYTQNAALGVARAHAAPMVSVHARLVADLEARAGLDRELEALPTAEEFTALEAAGLGLTSPELATLMAHVKLALTEDVRDSEVPDLEASARRLPDYFPTPLRERFSDVIGEHPLRREIVTTLLVNELVGFGGVSYAFRLAEEAGATAADAVRAFVAATHIYDLPSLWREIAALDNVVPTEVTDHLVLESRRLLDRASRWLLSNRPQPLATGAEISRFADPMRDLAPRVTTMLRGSAQETVTANIDDLIARGVPAELAQRVAVLLDTYGLLDVIEVAELAERDGGVSGEAGQRQAAELYFALSEHLHIDELQESISALDRGDRWHALARLALRDDLYSSLRAITVAVARHGDPTDPADIKIARWEDANFSRLSRARAALQDIYRIGRLDLATLSVAVRQVRAMAD